jgi:hypothetical protein
LSLSSEGDVLIAVGQGRITKATQNIRVGVKAKQGLFNVVPGSSVTIWHRCGCRISHDHGDRCLELLLPPRPSPRSRALRITVSCAVTPSGSSGDGLRPVVYRFCCRIVRSGVGRAGNPVLRSNHAVRLIISRRRSAVDFRMRLRCTILPPLARLPWGNFAWR